MSWEGLGDAVRELFEEAQGRAEMRWEHGSLSFFSRNSRNPAPKTARISVIPRPRRLSMTVLQHPDAERTRPPRGAGWRRYTPEQRLARDAEMTRLYLGGTTYAGIAAALGISVHAVSNDMLYLRAARGLPARTSLGDKKT